ncbi:uncharacterized protein LOC127243818 isoform X2 [Andrographis paniculata]|uniref:uncharacterized protein LOC127243818 isoform X2 n=1 Tax=Andrographis paniculata TaxID=175694 RepID=UPI0021E8EC44|nr:uncharacterized protein LOC127243818 isoform X2 [Andrographis paniculata]
MAAASPSSLLLPLPNFSSTSRFPHRTRSLPLFKTTESKSSIKPTTTTATAFALTESSSGSPQSLGPDLQILLQELADCFVLPDDYFQQLPRDLRLDCGEELGQTLLNITRAWELADASTSANLMSKLPVLVTSLTSSNKSALGKRLVSASRRFQSMGQYGQGELQQIAIVMNKAGKLLSTSSEREVPVEDAKQESRVLKFGELQVELTANNAFIGAVIGFIFGILSWQVSRGIQSIPESSLEYANDNALLIAKSLRGFLLALFYTSAVLSGFASVGLVLLGGKLKFKKK